MNGSDSGAVTPGRTVALVARREFTTRVRTKAFLIGNAVILVLILAGIITTSIVSGSSGSTTVGLVGTATDLAQPLSAATAGGDPIRTSTVPDEGTAQSSVASGALDVALVPRHGSGTGYTALVDKTLPPNVRTAIDAAVRQQAVDAALRARNVDPSVLTKAADRRPGSRRSRPW